MFLNLMFLKCLQQLFFRCQQRIPPNGQRSWLQCIFQKRNRFCFSILFQEQIHQPERCSILNGTCLFFLFRQRNLLFIPSKRPQNGIDKSTCTCLPALFRQFYAFVYCCTVWDVIQIEQLIQAHMQNIPHSRV